MTEANELSVSPLELFFDLVFVFAITQIVALIEHDLSPVGVAKGALVLAMIYWGWSLFTWTLNAVGTDRMDIRLGLLVAMAMSLLMALVIPDASETADRILWGRTSSSGWSPTSLPSDRPTRTGVRCSGGSSRSPWRPAW